MLETDPRVADALERLVPRYHGEQGDWERVVAATRPRRVPRLALALATAVAAVLVLALAWPFADAPRRGVLDRALAAVGEGPVLHVVLRGEWGGVNVDLETGRRTDVHGETELWYDRDRNMVRSVSRLGGAIQDEEVYEPREGPREEILALAVGYREALESGSARVAGTGEVDGGPVYWITVRRGPPGTDWEQQVGVSRRTFEPVATRSTHRGKPDEGGRQRILQLETLPRDAADLGGRLTPVARGPYAFSTGFGEELTRPEAEAVMGHRLLWAGPELEGLRLGWIGKVEDRGPEGESTGVMLGYGTVAAEQGDRFRGAYVSIRETVGRPVGGAEGSFEPPAGAVFLRGGSAYLVRDGIHIRIAAASEELALTAARRLRPYP